MKEYRKLLIEIWIELGGVSFDVCQVDDSLYGFPVTCFWFRKQLGPLSEFASKTWQAWRTNTILLKLIWRLLEVNKQRSAWTDGSAKIKAVCLSVCLSVSVNVLRIDPDFANTEDLTRSFFISFSLPLVLLSSQSLFYSLILSLFLNSLNPQIKTVFVKKKYLSLLIFCIGCVSDLDPCINVTCDFHGTCKAFGPFDPRCICEPSCPSFEDPVCTSNGTTYDNKCKYRQEMCRLSSNQTIFHPGDCTGKFLCIMNFIHSSFNKFRAILR